MRPEEISDTEAAIRSIVGYKMAVRNYTSSSRGLIFWLTFLIEGQAEEIEKLDVVSLPSDRVKLWITTRRTLT